MATFPASAFSYTEAQPGEKLVHSHYTMNSWLELNQTPLDYKSSAITTHTAEYWLKYSSITNRQIQVSKHEEKFTQVTI